MSPMKALRIINRRTVFLSLLYLVTGGLIYLALIIPFIQRNANTGFWKGSVADRDIVAPYTLTFPSAIRTAQQQEDAAHQVQPVYTAPDLNIGRHQLERLQIALAYITSVRADTYASFEQKLADLVALKEVQLSDKTAISILQMSDLHWQAVQQEALVVLEQAMRATLRPEEVAQAQQRVNSLVNLSLTDEQIKAVSELVSAFIVPNSFYDPELTDNAYAKAREEVEPVMRTYVANEIIVQRGQVINDEDIEALQAFELVESEEPWKDMTGAALLMAVIMFFFLLYFARYPEYVQDLRALLLIDILFLAFLFAARMTVAGHTVLPYLFPLAAYGLTINVLFDSEIALATSLPLAILVAYSLPNALDLALYHAVGSFFGILVLRRGQRLTRFFWAGAAVAFSGILIIFAFRLPQVTMDLIGLTTLSLAACFTGIASGGQSFLDLSGYTSPTASHHCLSQPDK